jgi:alkylation response protein AidB-like acyl-CoA dehydrogenase
MDFDLSEDQLLLKDQARKFLEDQCTPAEVRRVFEGDESYHPDLWRSISEMGWLGAALPEEYGGVGMGYVELCVIAEELGRSLAPVPFSSTVYLAAEAILLAGSEDQKQKYLPQFAMGEIIGTLALAEGPGTVTAASIQTSFADGTLSGHKLPVPDGDVADIAVVAARDQNAPGDGTSLYIVHLNGKGIDRKVIETLDPGRSHARIDLNKAAAEPLGRPGEGPEILDQLFDRAAVLFSFEQLGGAQRALEMARDYAMERFAFGRPVGSFQAIKHKLADMYVATELARSNCFYGAWALSSESPELPVAAATARLGAIKANHLCSKENIQTHGGMGFTWEFDCHLYYRRAKLLALALGGEPEWQDRLIDRLRRQRPAAQEAAQ